MSWIRTIPENQATGLLAKIYDETRRKHGRVINLVQVQSLRPQTMDLGRQMYRHLMDGPGGLSRVQRYLIATIVSKTNGCHYWMESHESDLRSEIKDDQKVRAIQEDYTGVALDEPTRGLLDFAVKMTTRPMDLASSDIETLRKKGFDDETIVDAVQTIGYFNYSNRVMDALGIAPEPGMRYHPKG